MNWTDILRSTIATGIRLPANDSVTHVITLAPSASAVPSAVGREITSIGNASGRSDSRTTPMEGKTMKDRIARAKALLDFASMISTEADIGVLFVQGGPNGIMSASCSWILEMQYRNEGEDASTRPSIIQFVTGLDAQGGFLLSETVRDAAKGSVIVMQSEQVEQDADTARGLLADCGRRVLVATCHS